MTTITFQTATRRSAPRLALPIAEAAAALLAKVQAWLRPRPLTRCEEAARLREYALQFSSQPGFAAELIAAADRHCQESE